MDLYYKDIVEPYIRKLNEIVAIDTKEIISGVGIKFNDKDVKYIKTKYKNEIKFIFIFIKYLTEYGVEFEVERKIDWRYYKYSIFILIIAIIFILSYVVS